MTGLTEQERARLERWQRGFPIVPRPFAVIARREGMTEDALLSWTQRLSASGILSRVGAVVRPNTAGASTLAAMSVPAARLEEVAAIVSAQPEVTHNYEREHEINLWFVVTAADRAAVAAALARIRRLSGLEVLDLPMVRAFHIDLGFAGDDGAGLARSPCLPARPATSAGAGGATVVADDTDRRILAAIEDGIPLVSRPFRAVGQGLGLDEGAVIRRLCRMLDGGVITRFGYVVHHRRLGFVANAMVVWDVPDEKVAAAGQALAEEECVTLCYQRPRRLPRWRYNLFCMIHGKSRAQVEAQVLRIHGRLVKQLSLDALPHAALFSRRRFKQCGARFSAGLKAGAA
jgi:DNA-binding Lrp family transcriptional regulator